LRKAAFALALAAALGAALVGALAKPRRATAGLRLYPDTAVVVKQINRYRNETWRWQRVMGMHTTPIAKKAPPDPSVQYVLWIRNLWRTRADKMRQLALNPPHKSQWLCIHRYEGSWSDSGSPYYGGLQMDLTFQRHYGGYLLVRKGTAEHWTPLEQMWVAEHAYRSGRGYFPWPNTARYCGLI
jgi:hypothetical protein